MTWCEEGKPQQAAGARLFGQRLHWQLVCSAAPGISGLTATRCRARCRVFIDVLTYWRYISLHLFTSQFDAGPALDSSWQLLTGWLAKIHQHSRYAEVVICLLELKTSQRQMTALSRQLFRRGPKKYGVWCVCIFKFIQHIPQRCELLAPQLVSTSHALWLSLSFSKSTLTGLHSHHGFHVTPSISFLHSLRIEVCDGLWFLRHTLPGAGTAEPAVPVSSTISLVELLGFSWRIWRWPWYVLISSFTTQAGHGWTSYTMMINNAIPLELKQTKLKLDFLMAWRLCEYVLDCLGFLEAFQVVSL